MSDRRKHGHEPRKRRGTRARAATGNFEIVDSIPAAVIVVAASDFTVLHANRASVELMGLDPAAIKGRAVTEVLPGDANGLLDLFRAARDSVTPLCVNHLRFSGDPDPDRVWTIHLTPCASARNERVDELVLLLADTTERMELVKAAERAADAERRRAEQLDAVFASMTDAVILVDDAGTLRKCNAAAEELFNLGATFGLRISASDLTLHFVDGNPIVPERLPLARALKMDVVEGEEATVIRAGRPRRTVSVSAAPVIVDGLVTGAVAVFHDVSEIHSAERRVARALRTQQRRTREARTLYHAARAVSSDLKLRDRLNVVAQTMAEAVGVNRCCILMLEDSTLHGAAAHGLSVENTKHLHAMQVRLRDLGSATKTALERRRPVYLADARSDVHGARRLANALDMRSALVVPLVYGSRVTGIAYLDEPGVRRRFTESDRKIASAISAHGAIAIENARLYEIEQDRSRMLEFMMAELNHRVKNNLAIVCGLLSLQLTKADPHATREVVLRDCIARIQSIALIHQILHEEDMDAVDMKETARRITAMVCDTFAGPGQKITYRVRGERLMLPCKLATSLGLAINELVCNAVKHGFAGRARGQVAISLGAGKKIRITVNDDGVGLPPGFDPAAHGHIGSLVVRGLIETELGGAFSLRRNPRGGATAIIAFPAPAPRTA